MSRHLRYLRVKGRRVLRQIFGLHTTYTVAPTIGLVVAGLVMALFLLVLAVFVLTLVYGAMLFMFDVFGGSAVGVFNA